MSEPVSEALMRQVLRKAADFVEKGWTRHTSARDARGKDIHPQSAAAVQFCASDLCVIDLEMRTELLGGQQAMGRRFAVDRNQIADVSWDLASDAG